MSEDDNQESEYENSIFFQNDNSDILWGGDINSIVIPVAEPVPLAEPVPMAEPVPIDEPLSSQVESIVNNRRIRRRNETSIIESNKIARGENGRRIVRPRTNEWNHVILKSGETLRFTNNDGKNILLTEKAEPHLLVRKILSKITECDVNNRLEYLSKFLNEDINQDSESDDNEPPINLKERVYQAYIKEYKLRYAFKRVWNLWQTYKLNKSYVPDIDPITISPPEKPVTLYDWKANKKFVLDGRSLSTLIESKLKYQECGFPIPSIAKNPFTNVDFTYSQMVSIYNQLRDHGELKWGLTTLRQYDFKINRWYQYHKSAITINAIRNNIRLLDTFEAREMLYDFICSKMEELDFLCGQHILNAYKRAMAYLPNHWYLESFKQLIITYYECEHFGTNKLRIINSNCLKLFRKQHLFIRDLHIRRII